MARLTQALWLFRDPVDADEAVTKGYVDAKQGGAHIVQDESVDLPAQARLNFQGTGVTASDDATNGQTDVVIPGDYAPGSHVGSRDGHPLAGGAVGEQGMMHPDQVNKLAGIEAGAIKRPSRIAQAPTFTAYTLALASATWTRLESGGVYMPRLDLSALGAPPSGTKWMVEVMGAMRVTPDVATDVYIGAGLGTNFTLGGSSMISGFAAAKSGHAFIPVAAAYDVPDPTVTTTITFSIQVFPAASVTVQNAPLPSIRSFLAVA